MERGCGLRKYNNPYGSGRKGTIFKMEKANVAV
jgi:hypothetical protein